jgi:hypothetical protein
MRARPITAGRQQPNGRKSPVGTRRILAVLNADEVGASFPPSLL